MLSNASGEINSPTRSSLSSFPDRSRRATGHAVLYCRPNAYARKFNVEMIIDGERRPVPLDWLDSFCMRNFTGSAEFDDTLPSADGRMEAGSSVDAARLAAAMGEWFTKRGKGNGKPVAVELSETK